MKKGLFVLCFALMFYIAGAATISGTAYEWYSLEPLPNVILDVNTVPNQTFVANDGTYSIEISEPGSYLIRAQYFENNILKYEAEELVDVQQDGNFRLDIIMFPSLEDDDFLFDELDDFNVQVVPEDEIPANDFTLLFIALIAIAGVTFYVFITRSNREVKSNNATKEIKNSERPSMQKELDEVVGILKNYGGRITQKELREKLPHSEAKVSLIVAELEHMGKIKKFKKGRGNILVLNE